MNSSRDFSCRRFLFQWTIGAALIIVLLHLDVVRHVSTRIVAGSQVGGLFAWEFWWFGHSRLWTHGSPFFTTLQMYPVGVPLFVHTPLILTVGLILSSLTGPFVAVNLIHLLSYVSCAAAMGGVAYVLTRDKAAAAIAGFLFMLNPFSITQHLLGHLGEATILFLPLTLLAVQRASQETRRRFFTGAFLAMLGAALTTTYVAMATLAVAVPSFSIVLSLRMDPRTRRLFLTRVATAAAAAVAIAAVFYSPVMMGYGAWMGGSEHDSISLLSLIDLPLWHPLKWAQRLLRWGASAPWQGISGASRIAVESIQGARPENGMGYMGISVFALLLWGAPHGAYTGHRAWAALVLVGTLFSLGPYLQVAYQETRIPLPYWIFSELPLLKSFRAPARLMAVTWTGISVLAALAVARLRKVVGSPKRFALWLALFVASYAFEMGLWVIHGLPTPLPRDSIVQRLQLDTGCGAVLELPVAISRSGDISINAQRYLLAQVVHGHPLVVGRPPRQTEASLAFCQNTDVVYELTHPWVLASMDASPVRQLRQRYLQENGAATLRKNGIRYVILHAEDVLFSPAVIGQVRRFLIDILGAPVMSNEEGTLLWDLNLSDRGEKT